MNLIISSLLVVLVLYDILKTVNGTGVFELRLKSFKNDYGKDHDGKCCSGPASLNSKCFRECRTIFRVCLKHYQAQIDTNTPCTFGDKLTPILGNNTIENMENLQIANFANPIQFPFDFTWPGTFSLIVEAFHVGNNSTNANPVLISRLTTQRWLHVNENWTEDIHKTPYSIMHYEFRVTCDPYYYEPGCANFCRSRNDQFGHYICSESGERICLPGWTGDYCSKPVCAPGCDEHHGHCNKPNECLCHTGWKGLHCSECERYPGCMHGNCSKPWECLCHEGWGGLFCNQDLNYCTNHKPCNNGGTCFNTGQGLYTCNCSPGYTGVDCEIELDNCMRNPCRNGGLCSNLNRTGYQCSCVNGFIGDNCEIPTTTCENHPCLNGATCQDNENRGFMCECPAGYNGSVCENQINDCLSNPCLNNGNCVDQVNGFQCICPSGFDGFICENNIDDCHNNLCKNGGKCIDGVQQYHCKCKDGYVGTYCENKVNLCVAKPCANNGKCTQLANDYNCTCKPGFTGKDCSIEIDECASQPCQNFAICLDRTNDYLCQCLNNYYGKNCEKFALDGNYDIDVEAQISSLNSSKMSRERYASVIVLSFLVPVLLLGIIIVVFCAKKIHQNVKQQADDEEARLQNEQNAMHNRCSFNKSTTTASITTTATITRPNSAAGGSNAIDPIIIKNSWNKCNNAVMAAAAANTIIVNQEDLPSSSSTFSTSSSSSSYTKSDFIQSEYPRHYADLNKDIYDINPIRSNVSNNKRYSTNYCNLNLTNMEKTLKDDLYSTPKQMISTAAAAAAVANATTTTNEGTKFMCDDNALNELTANQNKVSPTKPLYYYKK